MKEKLKQIRFINTEIVTLEEQIATLQPIVSADKVKGSSPYFPYTAMSFNIGGIDIEDYNRRAKKLKNKLIKKKNELLTLQEEVQNFIDKIEDCMIRQIIINRFINGHSWVKVARDIGGDNTADGVRMLVKRYLDNI